MERACALRRRGSPGKEVRSRILIVPAFHFGPDNGYTKAQWHALREPIGVPLPSRDGWLSAEFGLTHLDALLEHHRRLFEIARRDDRPLTTCSPEVRARPRIVGDGTITLFFPWTDTYTSTDSILSGLCAKGEGELLWDLDQGWEILARRVGAGGNGSASRMGPRAGKDSFSLVALRSGQGRP